MKIIYDPDADALNIAFKKGKVKKTVDIAPEVLLDIDAKSRPINLEILGVKEKLGKSATKEVSLENLVLKRSGRKTLAFG